MIKEIFVKFKRIDKTLKTHAEHSEGNTSIPEYSLRWQHTILQFLCHRLLRFLKYSSKAPDLLHYIKYSISYLDHRQIYRDAEMFAIHVMVNYIYIEKNCFKFLLIRVLIIFFR